MSKLFPRRSNPPEPDESANVVDLTDEQAGTVVEALAAETTRELLAAIYAEPAPTTELADRLDTSLQNTNYHLAKLEEADLIAVGDTWYAEGGNEMNVYVPTAESLVLHAGKEETSETVGNTLAQLLGAVGILGVASVIVERLVTFSQTDATYADDAPAETAVDEDAQEEPALEEAAPDDTELVEDVPTEAADAVAEPSLLPLIEAGGWLTPGVFFFLSGLAVLVVVVAITFIRQQRN